MNGWTGLLAIVLLLLLVLLRLLKPRGPRLSGFERARRVKLGDESALLERDRVRAAPVLWSGRRIISLGLLLGLLGTLTASLGLGWALVIVGVLILGSGLLETEPPKVLRTLYGRIEPSLLKAALGKPLRYLPGLAPKLQEPVVGSTDELTHIIRHASFLDADERALVTAALDFPGLRVRNVMRPRAALETIDKAEVLGPLVIDDLYKTGEAVFLVTDGDPNRVIGLLPLDKLTRLELTSSPTALKAMDGEVEFIDGDAPVSEAIGRLRDVPDRMLVVQDAQAETLGAVSLGEIVERLFGA